jgi:CheY-like chemotaxis protein
MANRSDCERSISHVVRYPCSVKKYNATILLVDDDADFLTFVERAFRQNGVTSPIHRAHDGAEAIAYMMGEGKYADRKTYEYPTFIMTDLKMPNADGFAVLQHLKSNPEWAIIPTVVFSASSDLDDIKKSYMLGASSYHVKPVSIAKLREHLDILHKYWMTCEAPEVDSTGRQRRTESSGKLGARFEQAIGNAQQVSAPVEKNGDPTAQNEPQWRDRDNKTG